MYMSTIKQTNTADMAIAYLSVEAKQTIIKLMASGDKDLQIIARLIVTESDYKTMIDVLNV
tara:strand:- start:967 stop:1149 length:183 start_codon:yes stop_codon:yes gene_type:complete